MLKTHRAGYERGASTRTREGKCLSLCIPSSPQKGSSLSFSGFLATNASILGAQREGEKYLGCNPNSPQGTDHFIQMQQSCFMDFLRLAEQGEESRKRATQIPPRGPLYYLQDLYGLFGFSQFVL